MAKHENNVSDEVNQRLIAEGKRIETQPLPGVTLGINLPDSPEPAERLRKVPALVTEGGLAVIRRAITLKLATLGILGGDDVVHSGEALHAIVGEWLQRESARLSGKGGGDG